MSKMNKFQYFLEIVWLCVGIISLILASYEFYSHGFAKSSTLYIISAISFAVYIIRRYARKTR